MANIGMTSKVFRVLVFYVCIIIFSIMHELNHSLFWSEEDQKVIWNVHSRQAWQIKYLTIVLKNVEEQILVKFVVVVLSICMEDMILFARIDMDIDISY
jgi:hypothetical protein